MANAVILQSPLLVYVAHPANMLANPSVDVLKSIPTTWDETVVLPVSEIREVAAFARRSGNTWFLAITNGPYARNVRIDLSAFLGKGAQQPAGRPGPQLSGHAPARYGRAGGPEGGARHAVGQRFAFRRSAFRRRLCRHAQKITGGGHPTASGIRRFGSRRRAYVSM